MNGGVAELHQNDGIFSNVKPTIVRQIDAPVPPLIVYLQRIRANFNQNGTLEYVNIECWDNEWYECRDKTSQPQTNIKIPKQM